MPANMKDSRIEWVGLIPEEWEVLRNKVCFTCSKEIVGSESDATQLLSLTTKGIKNKRPEDTTGKVPETYDTYQLVEPNDLVMCLFDLDVSAVFSGRSSYYGMISPAYKVLKCNSSITPKFAEYWFEFVFDGRKFKHYSKNLRYTLNYDEFAALPIIVPKRDAQEKIASFLDSECARIDSVIEKTQASIEEYKKLKQAIITEAVTRGLRTNRKMKDSGIDWIGEIPAEWTIQKIKNVSKIYGRIGFRGYTTDDLVSEGEGAITLSPSNIRDLKMTYDKCSYISWEKYEESPEIQIEKGDIIFVKTGSSYGKSGLVRDLPLQATINPQLIVFKNITIDNRFFLYALQMPSIRNEVEGIVSGGTIPTMAQEKIKNFHLCIPSTKEQSEISNYLDAKCSEIDRIMESKKMLVEKVEEMKKAIVFEYVTGKREVPFC